MSRYLLHEYLYNVLYTLAEVITSRLASGSSNENVCVYLWRLGRGAYSEWAHGVELKG